MTQSTGCNFDTRAVIFTIENDCDRQSLVGFCSCHLTTVNKLQAQWEQTAHIASQLDDLMTP